MASSVASTVKEQCSEICQEIPGTLQVEIFHNHDARGSLCRCDELDEPCFLNLQGAWTCQTPSTKYRHIMQKDAACTSSEMRDHLMWHRQLLRFGLLMFEQMFHCLGSQKLKGNVEEIRNYHVNQLHSCSVQPLGSGGGSVDGAFVSAFQDLMGSENEIEMCHCHPLSLKHAHLQWFAV